MSRLAKKLFSVLDSVPYLKDIFNRGDGKTSIYSHNVIRIISRPFLKAVFDQGLLEQSTLVNRDNCMLSYVQTYAATPNIVAPTM